MGVLIALFWGMGDPLGLEILKMFSFFEMVRCLACLGGGSGTWSHQGLHTALVWFLGWNGMRGRLRGGRNLADWSLPISECIDLGRVSPRRVVVA